MRSRRIPKLFATAGCRKKPKQRRGTNSHGRLCSFKPKGIPRLRRMQQVKGKSDMLIFEQLVSRGLMVFDPNRKVLTFSLPVIAKLPALRQAKIEEFKWLVGDWAFENHVRATPTTPAYTDTYYYTYELADSGTRYTVSGHGAKARPYLTFDPFSNRWMMTFTEGLFGVLQSNGWQRDAIVFSGPLTMLGIDCELRQTITKKSSDEFHILNEEKLPDGSWRETDEFFCRRKQP